MTVRAGLPGPRRGPASASVNVLLPPIGDIPAAVVAAVVFLGVGLAVGMVPEELRDVLGREGLLRRGLGRLGRWRKRL